MVLHLVPTRRLTYNHMVVGRNGRERLDRIGETLVEPVPGATR
jgi:hypothetical protein